MYKIGLRDGSPVSVGRMIEVDGEANSTINTGHAICIVDGVAKPLALGICPDAIASEAYKEGNKTKIVAMLLTEDMILEVPALVSDVSNVKVGAFIGCGADNVNDSEGSDFCQIIDTLDFKKSGDKILVRFLHNNVNS